MVLYYWKSKIKLIYLSIHIQYIEASVVSVTARPGSESSALKRHKNGAGAERRLVL